MEKPGGVQGTEKVAVSGEQGWRPKKTIGLQSQQTAAALEVPNLERVASGTTSDHAQTIGGKAEGFGSVVMSFQRELEFARGDAVDLGDVRFRIAGHKLVVGRNLANPVELFCLIERRVDKTARFEIDEPDFSLLGLCNEPLSVGRNTFRDLPAAQLQLFQDLAIAQSNQLDGMVVIRDMVRDNNAFLEKQPHDARAGLDYDPS